MEKRRFILASGSPRRIQMLEKHGIVPEVIKPEVEETLPPNISMEQAVMYLALKKALSVEELCKEGLIVAADTVVYKDYIIGKPKDKEDAIRILRHLCGQKHFVATGVAFIDARTSLRRIFYEATEVFFKNYDDQVIEKYIATGEVWDKAGGYAIQGGFAPYIDHIKGDYDNVVGFPWTRIQEELTCMGYGGRGEFLERNGNEKEEVWERG